jgi:hypothetical protein
MDAAILVKSLIEVPETKLEILKIAKESVGENGELDNEQVAFRMKEVKEAAAEAEAYAQENGEAVAWLKKIALS